MSYCPRCTLRESPKTHLEKAAQQKKELEEEDEALEEKLSKLTKRRRRRLKAEIETNALSRRLQGKVEEDGGVARCVRTASNMGRTLTPSRGMKHFDILCHTHKYLWP